jgi:hypothetical protein
MIQARLAEQTFGKPDIRPQKVFSDGRDITWFDRLRARFPDDNSVHAESFVMAVYPSYLKDKFPGLEPQEYGATREKQFERVYAPDKLLRSITRIALTVDKAEADQLTGEFAAYGYTIRDAGEKKIAVGPEFELKMIPVSEGAPRKVAISMKLNYAEVAASHIGYPASAITIIELKSATVPAARSAPWSFLPAAHPASSTAPLCRHALCRPGRPRPSLHPAASGPLCL